VRRQACQVSRRNFSMSKHIATLEWKKNGPSFLKGQYSREHTWTFDGGVMVPASSSPSVVPKPWSNPANVDPEEAFVAALASCHMLTFLWLASKQGFEIESYSDEAAGELKKNERGVFWVSLVTLHPRVGYAGDKRPTAEEEAELHHRAHEECFIANSVKTEVRVAEADSV
jgi:organic hydroperoxide reductase OsmC/OhrA